MKYILKVIEKSLPVFIRNKIDYWRFKRLVKGGLTLIDEEVIKKEYRRAIKILADDPRVEHIGDYLEFGVFYGSSIVCIHECLQELGIRNVRMFGFDSFEGLPEGAEEEDEGAWHSGQFNANYEFAKEYIKKKTNNSSSIKLIKGWYDDTLTEETKRKHNLQKASIIMVDCDMYSSSKTALDFCSDLIQDVAIIFFDDWGSMNLAERGLGERKAFEEFMSENSIFSYKCIGRYEYQGNMNGRVFRVLKSDS